MLDRLKSVPILDLLRSSRVRVEGHSMEPLLQEGDHILIASRFRARNDIRRGDVVAVRDPNSGGVSIKRVCGLPNERIGLVDGAVYVDGEPLPEPYVSRAPLPPRPGEVSQWRTGTDDFVLLGDNRGDSLDSRAYGAVPRAAILGRAWYRYAPKDRSGRLPR